MAWRCRIPTARRSQHGSGIAKNDLVKNYRVHPTHWLISTQVLTALKSTGKAKAPRYGATMRAKVAACVEINQCVGYVVSGEEFTPPRRQAGVASMAWKSTRRFRTNAP